MKVLLDARIALFLAIVALHGSNSLAESLPAPPFVVNCGPQTDEAPFVLAEAHEQRALGRNRLVSVPDVRYTAAQKYGHQGGEGYRHWHGGCRPSLGPQWEGDLFASGRVPPNSYSFAIPTGKYQVTIGICEGDVHVVGQRVFDVLVDGKVVAKDVDPIARAGYKEPMMLAASVHLEDDRPLAISFRQKSDRAPIVSAIWVTPLPDPDGKPGDATKPVQVYILAGQSNTVSMGNISGAKNVYDGVFLSSDPAVPDRPLQIYRVGNYKTSPLNVYLPDGTPTDRPVAEGRLEVPQQGVYQLQCGFGESSFCVMQLDGKEVYRRDTGGEPVKQNVILKPGTRYAFKISGINGDAPRFWMAKTDLLGNGDLEAVAKREGKFPWLVDGDGNWTVRNDVYFQEARLAKDGKGSPLTATSNGKSIGPELGFGHVLGTFHDEQVLLIKTAQGNRSLGFDFRPPSSGRTDPNNEFESAEYKLMVEGVRKTLDNIGKVVPGYKGQGYEIAGFQGHKDSFSEQSIAKYEKHLVNLINDVRKEFDKPRLPVVVATVGFGGHNMQDKFQRIRKAQLAVGDAQQHPEFAGTVASVDTRDFWREVDESPMNQDYHYNRNAETYMLIGDALGRAMIGLLGGKVEPLPQSPRPKRLAGQEKAEPSEEEKAAAKKALTPIIVDGIAASYIATPRYNKSLLQEAAGERPQRASQFLRGSIYGLVNCYRAAGIDDYDWRPFGPDLNNAEWDYISFDPPETLPADKGNRYRKVTFPDGMANWNAPEFDADKAGWMKGWQPFGQLDGQLEPLSETCTAPFCGCSEKPRTLWEKEVLLIRGTFDFPPLKKDHRYRIVLGGAAHVNSGEGYAIYVNGKLLAESKAGVAVRQGGQPRAAHIYKDFREEFNGIRVTIAATSFLRYNHPRKKPYPPRGHITLQIEEQKLPPELAKAASDHDVQ